jgi:hypothetical protein
MTRFVRVELWLEAFACLAREVGLGPESFTLKISEI